MACTGRQRILLSTNAVDNYVGSLVAEALSRWRKRNYVVLTTFCSAIFIRIFNSLHQSSPGNEIRGQRLEKRSASVDRSSQHDHV